MKRKRTLRELWELHFLRYELIAAAAIAIAFTIWVEFCGGRDAVSAWLKGTRTALYPAIVSAFGSLFGFVITAMSIILTWADKEKFDSLRSKPGYVQLWPVFGSTVKWLGGATAIAVVALIVDREGHDEPLVWFAAVFIALTAVLRLVRCVWVLENLILYIAPIKREEATITS